MRLGHRHSGRGRHDRWRAGVVLAVELLAAASIAAQRAPAPDLRTGPYGSVGAGYGSAPVSATIDGDHFSDTQDGFTLYLAAGVALNPHLRIGGEWDHSLVTNLFSPAVADGQNGSIDFFSFAVAYYPSLTKNLWFKANLGWAKLQTSSSTSGASSESGVAGGIGAGYDLQIGKSDYVLIPFVNYLTQFSSSGLNGFLQNEGSGEVSLFQIGVGIGYHH